MISHQFHFKNYVPKYPASPKPQMQRNKIRKRQKSFRHALLVDLEPSCYIHFLFIQQLWV